MKPIKIVYQNKSWFYQVSEGSDYTKTIFYTQRKVMVKKYFFFGSLVERTVYDFMFELPGNIESPNYQKSDIVTAINKKIALLKREEEIAKGEII